MEYNLNKTSFINIIKEISKKRTINPKTLSAQPKFFKEFDKIHPAWCSLLALKNKDNQLISLNSPKKFANLISLAEYSEYVSGFTRNDINDYWKVNFIDIWTPFTEKKDVSLKTSNNKWGDVNKITINEESFKEHEKRTSIKWTEELKKEQIKIAKERMTSIFNAHGELYANSVTHAFDKTVKLAWNSQMTSFVSYQSNGDIILFHVDLGSTIPTKTKDAIDLPDKKRIEWALSVGNSSKDPKEYPIRGLGSIFLKMIKAIDPDNDIVGITGQYSIELQIDENEDEDVIEDAFEQVNTIIKPKITKNDFNFPGTAWFIKFNGESQSFDELEEIIEFVEDAREQDNNLVKEYLV